MSNPEYRSWSCPSCPWVRTWRIDVVGYQEFDHPLHGRVTGVQSAQRDIARHDCEEFIAARGRLRFAQGRLDYDSPDRKPRSDKSGSKQAA